MEQALYISSPDLLSFFTPEFTRIYFGQEFCERLLPDERQIDSVMEFAARHHVPVTFVTPYVTNPGLAAVEARIRHVAEAQPGGEVVFNDWGVYLFLAEEVAGMRPVLGRLLNKTKRGPRIVNIIEQVPPETRGYYQGSNLDVPAACRFLKERGIRRVEFDNPLQGLDLSGTDPEIAKSLYLPFAFVSTTRLCLSANCADPDAVDRVGVFACAQECRSATFSLYNPVMRVPLIRRGNTQFIVNEQIPDVVSQGLVDRIVVQPEIPL
jgi:hypothetical protein